MHFALFRILILVFPLLFPLLKLLILLHRLPIPAIPLTIKPINQPLRKQSPPNLMIKNLRLKILPKPKHPLLLLLIQLNRRLLIPNLLPIIILKSHPIQI